MKLLTLNEIRSCLNRRVVEAAIRKRCHSVPLDKNTVLCRVLGRYKFFVDSRDQGLAPHLMLDGYWEYWVTDFILRNIKLGDVVFDVGANLGYYSVLMAEIVGETGIVYAFEPNPSLCGLVSRNIGINGFSSRTMVVPKAVTDRAGGSVWFEVSTLEPKNGSIADDSVTSKVGPTIDRFEVTTTSLDEYSGMAVDFIKVDVEGAEESLWNGMQNFISANPDIKILMEFNAQRCKNPTLVLDQMASLFELRKLDFDAVVRRCSREDLLSNREDSMLYLSRKMPVRRRGSFSGLFPPTLRSKISP
jgi:FkbM family methyltransferase